MDRLTLNYIGELLATRLKRLGPPIQVIEALRLEQELLDRVPTWPWQPGTARAMATTLILPVIVWFITRALERVFRF